MIAQIHFNVLEYVYLDFILAVIVVVEMYKAFLPARFQRIHPKWVTLFIAIIFAVIRYFVRTDNNVEWLIISLGIAVLGYDYIIKPFKDKIETTRAK